MASTSTTRWIIAKSELAMELGNTARSSWLLGEAIFNEASGTKEQWDASFTQFSLMAGEDRNGLLPHEQEEWELLEEALLYAAYDEYDCC